MPGLLAAKWLSSDPLPSNRQSGRDRDGCVMTVHMEEKDMGTERGLLIPPLTFRIPQNGQWEEPGLEVSGTIQLIEICNPFQLLSLVCFCLICELLGQFQYDKESHLLILASKQCFKI